LAGCFALQTKQRKELEGAVTKATAIENSTILNAKDLRLAAIAGLVALADWLFYDRPLGISVALFLTALFTITAAANQGAKDSSDRLQSLGVFAAGIVPILHAFTWLSLLFAIAATALSLQMMAHPRAAWRQHIRNASNIFPDMIWRALSDSMKLWHEKSQAKDGAMLKSMAAWIVPIVLGTVFLSLFASANPIVDDWLAAIDIKALFGQLSAPRVAFWLLAAAAMWPLVFLRNRLVAEKKMAEPKSRLLTGDSELFGKTAIIRSLILFNLLFMVQTMLDAAYLWGGLQLPRGMNYATYAHRGAYPLIVTALLAAAFVLFATRPGSSPERSALVRNLFYLWVAQNILLVISSVQRLTLYVDVYSLTYWRVAAFVWMLLVAIGLILIVIRLMLARSSEWLVATNVASLCLVLYACCFVNFPLLIANYNVTHSREVSGSGATLDLHYLLSLGPHAIPALDRFVSFRRYNPGGIAAGWSDDLANKHLLKMEDWRAWTYSDWQLSKHLQFRKAALDAAK
jgi:hypothetical protein